MKNEIKRTISGVISQAERALPGMLANQEKLGLVLVDPVAFKARLEKLKTERDNHARAVVVLNDRRKNVRTAIKDCRSFGMTAGDVLNVFFGRKHSSAHEAAGFAGSMRIPRGHVGLTRLLQGLKSHFDLHPAHEVSQFNVTAARAKALHDALYKALAALDQQKSVVRELMKVRDGWALLVRKDLSALLAEIRIRAGTTAPVWEDFGFKRPGILGVPEAPENVVVKSLGDNSVMVKCDRAARGRRYQLWEKIEGVNEDFVLVETKPHHQFARHELPAEAEVSFLIVALNNGGESRRSETATFQVRSAERGVRSP